MTCLDVASDRIHDPSNPPNPSTEFDAAAVLAAASEIQFTACSELPTQNQRQAMMWFTSVRGGSPKPLGCRASTLRGAGGKEVRIPNAGHNVPRHDP